MERMDVQTNEARMFMSQVEKTVSQLRDDMPNKVDKSAMASLERKIRAAAQESIGKMDLPSAPGARTKVDGDFSQEPKFHASVDAAANAQAVDGGGGGSGDSELRAAVMNLETQLMNSMALTADVQNKMKHLIDDRKLRDALGDQWESVMSLMGGDDEAFEKQKSRIDNMEMEVEPLFRFAPPIPHSAASRCTFLAC